MSSSEQLPERRRAARVQRKRKEVRALENREPLRRRILTALGERPLTTGELAAAVDASESAVARLLTEMRAARLLGHGRVGDDGRRRQNFLTLAGETELADHRAFGTSRPSVPDPSGQQIADYLWAALEEAVAMRRTSNRLEEAADRIRVVLERAQVRRLHDLAVEARFELATTLRQDRQFMAAAQALAELEQVTLDNLSHVGASLVLPAFAHREYAFGRMRDESAESEQEKADHLTAAARTYADLAQRPPYADTAMWRRRHAWAVVAHANNLRARSRLEEALGECGSAMALFDDLNDDYGRSRSLFMFGFCLRLMGDFSGARAYLDGAHRLAAAKGFQRFRADSLMQLGEVCRCQDDLGAAEGYLSEAFELSTSMDLKVTLAFSHSAWGALLYQRDDFGAAAESFARAHDLFEQIKHADGLALNERRQAVVARRAEGRSVAMQPDPEGLIDSARGRYAVLRSPAGVAACDVEWGRLNLERGRPVDDAVEVLLRRLGDDDQRELIELDPWVPYVLCDFASHADAEGADELRECAGQSLRRAHNKLSERALRGRGHMHDAITVIGQPRSPLDLGVGEMGGETRQYQEPLDIPGFMTEIHDNATEEAFT